MAVFLIAWTAPLGRERISEKNQICARDIEYFRKRRSGESHHHSGFQFSG
jgi:hypothetical protein